MQFKSLHINLFATWLKSCRRVRGMKTLVLLLFLVFAFNLAFTSCQREPELHLHDGQTAETDLPLVDLDLDVYWDYEIIYGIKYDWEKEWYYGWDDEDVSIFGEIGYSKPTVFNLRRYFTEQDSLGVHNSVLEDIVNGFTYHAYYNYGFWDILVWNDIQTIDGVQSLVFDETTSLEYVTAYTHQTMNAAHYSAPKYTHSFYEPEALFAAYQQGIHIDKNHTGFEWIESRNAWVKTLEMQLEPITYIYLVQVILHHNNGRISQVDGTANLSGMARSVTVNDGVAGSDAITVSYNVRLKKGCDMNGENVDIVGGRMLTFGMCNVNPNRIVTRADQEGINDAQKHYIDVTMQFNTGIDSTFVFDVTPQVRKRYKGGVITVELDMDTVPVPKTKGGSGFDAVVKDFEDGGTHEFDM